MFNKLFKLAKDPRKYLPIAARMAQVSMCRFFRGTCYLQAQMDIHPKSPWHNKDFAATTGGYLPERGREGRQLGRLHPCDTVRRDMLLLLLKQIEDEGVHGAFAELGVFRGQTARLIHHYAPSRRLYLFDTFEGFTARGEASEKTETGHPVKANQFSQTSIEVAKMAISPVNSNVSFHKGYFPDTVTTEIAEESFSFVHLV